MKHKTNVEAVVDLMEWSKYGALAQVFVIDALVKQAARVANAPPGAIEDNGFIAPEAWRGVAREIAEKLERHLDDAEVEVGDEEFEA
jgi:hypothetical protein